MFALFSLLGGVGQGGGVGGDSLEETDEVLVFGCDCTVQLDETGRGGLALLGTVGRHGLQRERPLALA